MKDLLILGINYNSDVETIDFINSVLNLKDSDLINLIIIDVGKRKDSDWFSVKVKQYPTIVKILSCDQNLGYFGAANYGLSEFLKTEILPKWIIVSNVDIEIESKNLVQNLMQYVHNKEIGIIAPSIFSLESSEYQNPYMENKPNALKMHFFKWIFKNRFILNIYSLVIYLFKKLLRKIKKKHANKEEEKIIYAPHGSFIIFNELYFLKGGNLKTPFFLFGEEIYVAEICKQLKLNILYSSSIKILHKEHISTGKVFKNKKNAKYLSEAASYNANHYFQ